LPHTNNFNNSSSNDDDDDDDEDDDDNNNNNNNMVKEVDSFICVTLLALKWMETSASKHTLAQ
jgi:hypothetical protein